MKLIRLKLNSDFRSLQNGFEVLFLRDFDNGKINSFMPYCLVGRNGSGKSNILEALSSIFYHIECIYLNYKPDGFEGTGDFKVKNPDGFFSEKCAPDAFELEYRIPIKWKMISKTWNEMEGVNWNGLTAHIQVTKKKNESPKIECLNKELFESNGYFKIDDTTKEETQELSRIGVKEILPEFIIGYSSGENEILSLPFFKMRFINFDEYKDSLRKETGYAQPEGRLVYIDNQYSQAVFLTNFLMQDEASLKPIFNAIGVKAIKKFRIIINQGKRFERNPLDQQGLIEEQALGADWSDLYELTELLKQKDDGLKDLKAIDKLIRCSTSRFFDEDDKALYLDYFIDNDLRAQNGELLRNEFDEVIGLSQTKKAFRAHFNNDPFELFRAFQTLLTLNLYDVDGKTKQDLYRSNSLYVNETVPVLASEKRIMRFKEFEILKGNSKISILSKSLSDGEHQYLHAMGICLLFKNTNSLFLLDEPETHLNPDWRAKFVSTLRDCVENDINGQNYLRDILITSHSPFIVSDCHEENVLVFKKEEQTRVVTANRPGFNTFGASVNQITVKVFGKTETIGSYSLETIDDLYRRLELGENKDVLIEEAFRILGDSVERVLFINKALEK
jgi:restriction system-associated AAA family ATPase